jgi:hypothetical protein
VGQRAATAAALRLRCHTRRLIDDHQTATFDEDTRSIRSNALGVHLDARARQKLEGWLTRTSAVDEDAPVIERRLEA